MKKAASNQSKVSAKRVASSPKKRPTRSDDLRPHYDFDRATGKPNRFAARFSNEAVAVVLDPDVASVFRDAETVNSFLRSAIAAMPATESRKRRTS
jgi:hypothetical protein